MKRASNLNGLRALFISPKTHKNTRLDVGFFVLRIQITGNSSYQVTANIYTHLQKEHVKRSAVSIEGVFSNKVAQEHRLIKMTFFAFLSPLKTLSFQGFFVLNAGKKIFR